MKPTTLRSLGLAVAAVLLLAGLAAAVVLPRAPALACLQAFQAPVPEDLESLAALPDGYRLLEDPARFGHGRVLLRPAAEPRAPTIVFVHGVAALGVRDGRILRAIDAFHAAGFTVLAPEVASLVDPLAPVERGEDLATLLRALASGGLAEVHPDRLGVVAISVGGGVALRGVARFRADGGHGVRAMLLIGAPDHMDRLVPGWFAAEPTAGPSDGTLVWERRNAAAFARNFLWRAALPARLGEGPAARRLADWMATDPLPPEPLEGVDDPRALEIARLLTAPAAERAPEGARVLREAGARIESLSPARFDDELEHLRGIAVFLLHGHGDPLVPIEEADRLGTRLRRHTLVTVLHSHMVGHTTVLEVGLGQKLAHLEQMDDFFAMIGR